MFLYGNRWSAERLAVLEGWRQQLDLSWGRNPERPERGRSGGAWKRNSRGHVRTVFRSGCEPAKSRRAISQLRWRGYLCLTVRDWRIADWSSDLDRGRSEQQQQTLCRGKLAKPGHQCPDRTVCHTNAGATWTQVFGAAQTGTILPASQTVLKVASGPGGTLAVGVVDLATRTVTGLFWSGNSGANWTSLTVPTPLNPGMQVPINFAITIDPSNPNLVYVSGD